jgi:hypothetical protein
MDRVHRLFAVLLALALGSAVATTQAVAQEWTIEPTIATSVGYDDNIFFTGASDVELRATPSLSMQRTDPRGYYEISAELDGFVYPSEDEFSRLDQAYAALMQRELTERTRFDLQLGLDIDNTFEETLLEEGVVAEKSFRYDFGFQPAFLHEITPRDSLEARYELRRVSYDDDDFFDRFAHTPSLEYRHELSRRTELLARGAYTRVDAADDAVDEEVDQNIGTLVAGIERDLNPRTRLSIEAGAAYVNETLTNGVDAELDFVEFIGDANLRYSLQRTNFTIGASREVIQSIFGISSVRGRVYARAAHEFSREWRGSLFVQFLDTETRRLDAEDRATNFAFATADLTWQFTRSLALRGAYNISTLRRQGDDEYEFRNRVFLQLRWTPETEYRL